MENQLKQATSYLQHSVEDVYKSVFILANAIFITTVFLSGILIFNLQKQPYDKDRSE